MRKKQPSPASSPCMPDWSITAKLLGLLARYEMGDTAFLQYEIRAYKRATRYTDTLRTEKLCFQDHHA
ncbi:MAG: hypothetical protein INR69_02905 [Mucilaginibacter polytrichastri]|nr:hypothetical protein [Mucilaginibacter polytrichastri]